MAAGADVNDAVGNGCTGVWLATRYGRSHSLTALMVAGVESGEVAKCPHDGRSPILMAFRYNNYKLSETMIAAGDDVNMCMWNGISVIWLAAQEGHDKCLGELIKAGGDVNKCDGDDGQSPFYNAPKNGHVWCLSTLI